MAKKKKVYVKHYYLPQASKDNLKGFVLLGLVVWYIWLIIISLMNNYIDTVTSFGITFGVIMIIILLLLIFDLEEHWVEK